jgi:hypothetical protein
MRGSRSAWIFVLCTFGAHAAELPNAWFCVDSQVGGFDHGEGLNPTLTRIQSSKYTLRKRADGYELIIMGMPADAPDELRKMPCQLRIANKDTAIICVMASVASASLFVMNTSTGVYERANLGWTTQTAFDFRGQSEIAYGTCTPIDE